MVRRSSAVSFRCSLQLLLNLCGARQLRVQSFAHVVELISTTARISASAIGGPAGPRVPWARVRLVRHVSGCGLAASASLGTYRVLCLAAWLTPQTPKGHKRPADVVSNALHVMEIATGRSGNPAQPKRSEQGRPFEQARATHARFRIRCSRAAPASRQMPPTRRDRPVSQGASQIRSATLSCDLPIARTPSAQRRE